MEKVERLADLLLDSTWTTNDLEQIVSAVTRAGAAPCEGLADRLITWFPSPPSRTALIGWLLRTKGLGRAVRLKLLKQQRGERRFKLSTMRASVPIANQWDIPPIADSGELALFLDLPSTLVDWLSSHRNSHYRIALTRKRSGGLRLIEAPKTKLKCVQHRIATQILNLLPVHSAVHGFVRNRSAVSYVQPHVSRSVVLRMDLKDFFPSITASRVFGLFRSLGYPHVVTHSLTNLSTALTTIDELEEAMRASGEQPFHYSMQNHATREQARSLYGQRHLPQGAPTSPALANLVAYRLDCRLAGLAASAKVTYTRYADDLLFSGNDDFGRSARAFAIQVGSIALDEGFEVNFRKTRVMRRSTRQFAAGIVINQRTNLQRSEYDQLKATLFNCVKNGPASQNRDARANFRMHLLGRINWVKQLNPARAAKLTKVFDEIDWSDSNTNA